MKKSCLPHRRGVRTAVVLPVLVLAFLFGCGCLYAASRPAQPAGPALEKTLRIGIGIQPDTLEPSQVSNSAVANVLEHVVDTLVTIDENGQIAPSLAERWEVSADGREYTFHLAHGVTFHDGTPLDANAVAWNVYRLINHPKADLDVIAECPVAAQLAAISRVEVVDSDTVVYKLARPVPNFLATVSWVAFGILSPRSVDLPGNKRYNIQHPVGTGP